MLARSFVRGGVIIVRRVCFAESYRPLPVPQQVAVNCQRERARQGLGGAVGGCAVWCRDGSNQVCVSVTVRAHHPAPANVEGDVGVCQQGQHNSFGAGASVVTLTVALHAVAVIVSSGVINAVVLVYNAIVSALISILWAWSSGCPFSAGPV